MAFCPLARALSYMNEEVHSICDYVDRVWPEGSKTRPPVDWTETDTEHVINVELPGLSKEDVDVWVEEGNLIINGDSKKELHKEEHTQERLFGSHRAETKSGHYRRKFLLPDNANVITITVNLNKGVLTVVVQKHDA